MHWHPQRTPPVKHFVLCHRTYISRGLPPPLPFSSSLVSLPLLSLPFLPSPHSPFLLPPPILPLAPPSAPLYLPSAAARVHRPVEGRANGSVAPAADLCVLPGRTGWGAAHARAEAGAGGATPLLLCLCATRPWRRPRGRALGPRGVLTPDVNGDQRRAPRGSPNPGHWWPQRPWGAHRLPRRSRVPTALTNIGHVGPGRPPRRRPNGRTRAPLRVRRRHLLLVLLGPKMAATLEKDTKGGSVRWGSGPKPRRPGIYLLPQMIT